MSKIAKLLMSLMVVGGLSFVVVGCEEEGPVESAAEDVDAAAEDNMDATNNAAEDAAEDTGDALDEAADDMNEAVEDATNN